MRFFFFPNRTETRRDETTCSASSLFLTLLSVRTARDYVHCTDRVLIHQLNPPRPAPPLPPRCISASGPACPNVISSTLGPPRLVAFHPLETPNQSEPKMPFQADKNDQLAINTIRTLALE